MKDPWYNQHSVSFRSFIIVFEDPASLKRSGIEVFSGSQTERVRMPFAYPFEEVSDRTYKKCVTEIVPGKATVTNDSH